MMQVCHASHKIHGERNYSGQVDNYSMIQLILKECMEVHMAELILKECIEDHVPDLMLKVCTEVHLAGLILMECNEVHTAESDKEGRDRHSHMHHMQGSCINCRKK